MGGSVANPDYMGAANAQGQQSQVLNAQQTAANRPNQYTPWGSSTWQQSLGKDAATGQPITEWTQTQTLDPASQAALDAQQNLQANRSTLANQQIGNVAGALGKPMDWGAAPDYAATPGVQQTQGTAIQGGIDTTTQTTNEPAFAQQRNEIANAMFQRMMPMQEQERAASRTRMANMGLPMGGSEAYNREANRLQTAHTGAQYDALMKSGEEQQRMQQGLLAQQGQAFGQGQAAGQFANQASGQQFGQNLQANAQNFGQGMQAAGYQNALRQSALGEQQQARQMPLNELNALIGGQAIQPQTMPSFSNAAAAQGSPYMQAAQGQGQLAAQTAPQWGSLLGMGAMGLGSYFGGQ